MATEEFPRYTRMLLHEMGRVGMTIRGARPNKPNFIERTGIPFARAEALTKGAEPTELEHRAICKALGRMRHFGELLVDFKELRDAKIAVAPPAAAPAPPPRRIVPASTPPAAPPALSVVGRGSAAVALAEEKIEHHASEKEKNAKPKLSIVATRLTPPPQPPLPLSPLEVKTSSKTQYSRIETIDPELAELLLQANVRNRPISATHVAAMVRDMAAGKWRLTHQGIALDYDGRLVDGQHRLTAIVESKTTQRLTVTYNVEPEAFHSIDVGLQPRSIAQVAGLIRGTKHSALSVAAVKVIWHVLEDNQSAPIRTTWTESEVFAMLDLFEPDLAWVTSRIRHTAFIRQGPVIAALAYAAPCAREEICEFVERMVSREGLTKTMAAFWKALERIGTAKNHGERIEMFMLTLRALQLHIKGEETAKLYVKNAESTVAMYYAQPVWGFFRVRRQKLGLVT